MGQNPVLACQRNHIGCDANRHQFQLFQEFRHRPLKTMAEGYQKFEGYTASAQVLEGIGAARLKGVEDGTGLG